MKKINKLFLKNDSKIEDAMSMFKVAIDANNLSRHTVKDWDTVYLSYLTDPEGWLAVWMIKSDELSSMLLRCRLWDAIYVKDSDCVLSIRAINRDETDDNSLDIDTYDKYPLASDIGVPMSLRLAIINEAFMSSLMVFDETKEVSISPVKGFYDLSEELKDGDVLPYQDPIRISSGFLNRHIIELNAKRSINLEESKEHDINS